MDFSDNSTHVTGYSGAHVTGNSSVDVDLIRFYSVCLQSNITKVPKGILEVFPNFVGINFFSCSFTSLNGDELDEYPNLQYYAYITSILTRVSANFFASTPNLKVTNFSGNRIVYVGEGLLDNLQNLQQAHFHNNICVSRGATNPSQIPALIEALKNCTGIETTTTTISTSTSTISTSTTTNQPPKCEIHDIEEFVCRLDEEIEILRLKIEELKASKEVEEILTSQIEALNVKNQELSEKFEDRSGTLLSLIDRLKELEVMVIEKLKND